MKKKSFVIIELVIFCILLIILFISITLLIIGIGYNFSDYTLYVKDNNIDNSFLPKLVLDKSSDEVKLQESLNKVDKVKVTNVIPEYVALKIEDNADENKIVSTFYGSYELKDGVLTISRDHGSVTNDNLDITLYVKYDLADVIGGNYKEVGKVDKNGNIMMFDSIHATNGVEKNLNSYISDIKDEKESIRVTDKVLERLLNSNELCIYEVKYGNYSEYYPCQWKNYEELYEVIVIDEETINMPYFNNYYNIYNQSSLIMVNDNKGYEYEKQKDKIVITNVQNNQTWDIPLEIETVEGDVIYG